MNKVMTSSSPGEPLGLSEFLKPCVDINDDVIVLTSTIKELSNSNRARDDHVLNREIRGMTDSGNQCSRKKYNSSNLGKDVRL